MKVSIIEGRVGAGPISDMRMLLIMERLKAAFLNKLEQGAQYLDDGDPLSAAFGFVFRDGREVFFEVGKNITPGTAAINWKATKQSKFALHAKLTIEGNVYCDLYFEKVFRVDEYDSIEGLKKIIDSANIAGLKYLD